MSPLLAPLLVSSLLLATGTTAQLTAASKAEAAFLILETWYNENTGIWNTCGWWNGANCMTAVADLAVVDSSVRDRATDIFNNTFYVAPSVNPNPGVEKVVVNGMPETRYAASWPPATSSHGVQQAASDPTSASGWLDGAYDDDSWWALAWIAAYDVTGNQDYLQLAINIFQTLTQDAGPTRCNNGGVYWDSAHVYINAISNELFMSVAAHLANRVPSNKNFYIDWAQREWEWFYASSMINSDWNINDGLLDNCGNNGATVWSYNQGVILGGLVELNRAAPNQTYLDIAGKIAQAAITKLADSSMIIHDVCEPNCAPDATQFKGIFIRNLLMLHSVAPQDVYAQVINACANSIWDNDRSNNEFSINWAGPFVNPANASTHSSAMDALVAAISV